MRVFVYFESSEHGTYIISEIIVNTFMKQINSSITPSIVQKWRQYVLSHLEMMQVINELSISLRCGSEGATRGIQTTNTSSVTQLRVFL